MKLTPLLPFLLSCLSCCAQFGSFSDQPFFSGTYPVPGIPQTIAGLQLWLAPESLSGTNDQVISTWTDSSGNGYHAKGTNGPTLTNSILNGFAGITFGTDTTKYLKVTNAAAHSAFTNLDGCTLFSVLKKKVNPAGDGHWFEIASPTASLFRLLDTSLDAHYFYSNKADSTNGVGFKLCASPFPTGFNVLTHLIQWTNVTLNFHINGASTNTITLQGTGQKSTTPVNNILLGAGSQPAFNGWLVELIAYSTVLSTSNRAVVELYLKTKYGL